MQHKHTHFLQQLHIYSILLIIKEQFISHKTSLWIVQPTYNMLCKTFDIMMHSFWVILGSSFVACILCRVLSVWWQ